jgi:hypothetical protein
VIGAVPVHVPVLEVNVCPCCADPEITGAAVELGATADEPTMAEAAEAAPAEPAGLVAVTIVRIFEPTSADANTYDDPVAPDTEAQLAPAESQRCHW